MREIVPGVLWLRMPLPMALDHINLYLLEDADGWWIVDTGIAIGPTQELWEQVFAHRSWQGKPVKAVLSTHHHPDHTGMAGWLVRALAGAVLHDRGRVFHRARLQQDAAGALQLDARRTTCSWPGYSAEQVEHARKHFGGFGALHHADAHRLSPPG